jgi:hypothetical protein
MSELNLKKLLAPKTSAEAQDNIATVEAALEETHVEVEAARNQRETALLSGTDAAVTKATEQLKAAELQFERLKLAHEKLQKRLPELIEDEEHHSAIDAVKAGYEAMQEGIALTETYISQGKQIAEILEALERCYERVSAGLRLGEEHELDTEGLTFPHAAFTIKTLIKEAWTETTEPHTNHEGKHHPGRTIEHEAEYGEWTGINLIESGIYLPGIRYGEPPLVKQK